MGLDRGILKGLLDEMQVYVCRRLSTGEELAVKVPGTTVVNGWMLRDNRPTDSQVYLHAAW